jgi:hypothetical protein
MGATLFAIGLALAWVFVGRAVDELRNKDGGFGDVDGASRSLDLYNQLKHE